MKNIKGLKTRFMAIVMIATLALGLAACGGGSKDISGTYSIDYTTEQLSGNLSNNGYLVAVNATQKNTLVLNKDGNYEYTKVVSGETAKVALTYKFTGSYSNEGTAVTLKVPTDVEFNEDWGQLQEAGKTNSDGKASEGATVQKAEGVSIEPSKFFSSPYYAESEAKDVAMTVDTDNATFTFAEATSSDDE
ncbi:hypothetical protein GC101_28175 [Paenibacillus sp. LMG 31459]|uniref:NEAT domain-containing protein n=1 Tax=Paenibacillus phytohabitans TaxID=2654978 RepID=A0ABX1YSL2_9BACL|nr:hypothetical protein [Paenibacillus phytohabitans]NOU82745.1 hypothetical protein [Paenibacillus phytohabitans]